MLSALYAQRNVLHTPRSSEKLRCGKSSLELQKRKAVGNIADENERIVRLFPLFSSSMEFLIV